jgi:hypothetical protein
VIDRRTRTGTEVRNNWKCILLTRGGNVRIKQRGTLPSLLFPWKSNKYHIFQVCFFGLNFPTRKAHAPCYIVILARSSQPYSSILSLKRLFFLGGGNLLNIIHVFWYYLKSLSETFLIRRRNKRDIIITLLGSSRNLCHILVKFEFSWKIFENSSNITSHKNSSIGSRVFPCGQTDEQANRHTWRS